MDWEEGPCFLCRETVPAKHNAGGTAFQYICPDCGEFIQTYQGTVTLEDRIRCDPNNLEVRAKIVGWIRRQNRQGKTPTIDADKIRELVEATPPTTKQRAMFLLEEAIFGTSKREPTIDLFEARYLNAVYSADPEDVQSLLFYLEKQELVRSAHSSGAVVTVEGRIAAEEQQSNQSNSETCFVAMWFDPNLSEIYEQGFHRSVTDAGYIPMRIDEVEHNNKIDDEIIAAIRSSAFLIADFTGHRGGVYFEAGFAMGLGMPVVWTCRENEVNDLHFDIRQYNCVTWTNAEDLASKLKNRIEATIGRGPV